MNVRQREAAQEEAVYRYICEYKAGNDGIPPSMREIVDEFGFASTNMAYRVLQRLVAQRRIRYTPGQARTIRVVGGEWVAPESAP